MTMPIRLRELQLGVDLLQEDRDHFHGEDMLQGVMEEDDAVTRPVRLWISPETAKKIALVARAHGTSSTVVAGAILREGVNNWPGRWETVVEPDEGPDPAQLIIEFDREAE